jgi:hypothetical protein
MSQFVGGFVPADAGEQWKPQGVVPRSPGLQTQHRLEALEVVSRETSKGDGAKKRTVPVDPDLGPVQGRFRRSARPDTQAQKRFQRESVAENIRGRVSAIC